MRDEGEKQRGEKGIDVHIYSSRMLFVSVHNIVKVKRQCPSTLFSVSYARNRESSPR